MAKLINILAASIGGGIVLGAGIRLGEAIATQLAVPGGEAANRLADRLSELEERLDVLEVEADARVVVQQPEPAGEAQVPSAGGAERIRDELRGWLEESVAQRMADVEMRLKAESERGQKQLLDAFSESVQTRVIQRISQLEGEVAGQSTALSELRECSLRTESSVQKLLGALDKLIVKSTSPEEEVASDAAAPAETGVPSGKPAQESAERAAEQTPSVEPPALGTRTRPRRWTIFG